MNQLCYGDNLTILCDYIKVESVNLIYLDPRFNSNRNYVAPIVTIPDLLDNRTVGEQR
jgi:site-specific DNA-methyltransferase (adenine-specific)